MKKVTVKRGNELFLIMCEISEHLAAIKVTLDSEIVNDSSLSSLKAGWRDSLVDCDRMLDKCIRVMQCLLPAKNAVKCAQLEAEISDRLKTLRKDVSEHSMFYSVIHEVIKPQMEEIYRLMNEYVVL